MAQKDCEITEIYDMTIFLINLSQLPVTSISMDAIINNLFLMNYSSFYDT